MSAERYVLYTPDNRVQDSEAFSRWSMNNVTVADSHSLTAPDGTLTAKKIMATSGSGQHYLTRGVSSAYSLLGNPLWYEFFWQGGETHNFETILWENSGRQLIRFSRTAANGFVAGVGYVHTLEVTSHGWYHFILVSSHTPSGATGGGQIDIYFELFHPTTDASSYLANSGDGAYFWHPRVGPHEAPYYATTGSQYIGAAVPLLPTWGAELGREKFEDIERTPAGQMQRYSWGTKRRWALPVEHLNSQEARTLNDWMRANTPLLFRDFNTPFSDVRSVMIGNKTAPIDEIMRPYKTDWAGIIELEEY